MINLVFSTKFKNHISKEDYVFAAFQFFSKTNQEVSASESLELEQDNLFFLSLDVESLSQCRLLKSQHPNLKLSFFCSDRIVNHLEVKSSVAEISQLPFRTRLRRWILRILPKSLFALVSIAYRRIKQRTGYTAELKPADHLLAEQIQFEVDSFKNSIGLFDTYYCLGEDLELKIRKSFPELTLLRLDYKSNTELSDSFEETDQKDIDIYCPQTLTSYQLETLKQIQHLGLNIRIGQEANYFRNQYLSRSKICLILKPWPNDPSTQALLLIHNAWLAGCHVICEGHESHGNLPEQIFFCQRDQITSAILNYLK